MEEVPTTSELLAFEIPEFGDIPIEQEIEQQRPEIRELAPDDPSVEELEQINEQLEGLTDEELARFPQLTGRRRELEMIARQQESEQKLESEIPSQLEHQREPLPDIEDALSRALDDELVQLTEQLEGLSPEELARVPQLTKRLRELKGVTEFVEERVPIEEEEEKERLMTELEQFPLQPSPLLRPLSPIPPLPLEIIGEPIFEEKLSGPVVDDIRSINQVTESLRFQDIPPLDEPNFNVDLVSNVIRRSLDLDEKSGLLFLENRDGLRNELRDIIEIGISDALTSPNRGINLQRAIRTIGDSLGQFDNVFGHEDIARIANNVTFSQISPDAIKTFASLPHVDSSVTVANLFDRDINELLIEDLSQATIRDIIREFDSGLNRFLLENPNVVEFQEIENYIEESVANPALRTALITKARQAGNTLRARLQKTITREPELRPLSMSRAVLIDTDPRRRLAELLSSELNTLLEDIDPEEIKNDLTRIESAVDDLIKNAQIGVDPAFEAFPGIVAPSRESLFKRIRDFIAALNDTTNVTFTYLPPVGLDGTPVNIDRLVALLQQDLKKIVVPKSKDTKISHPESIATFGQIQILRKRVKNKFLREIVIPPSAHIEDVIKLATSLISEDGDLENIKHQPLIRIVKGSTQLEDIITLVLNEQKHNVGKTVKFLYIPRSPVGGQMLDGYLKPLLGGALLKPLSFRPNRLHPSPAMGMLHRAKGGLLQTPIHKFYHPLGVESPPFKSVGKGGSVFGIPRPSQIESGREEQFIIPTFNKNFGQRDEGLL